MTVSQEVAKSVAKGTGNNRPLQLGDRVQHTISHVHGTVIEVGKVNTETVLSIRTINGRELRKLNAKEFVLDNSPTSPIIVSYTDRGEEIPISRLEGSISDRSILDEIV